MASLLLPTPVLHDQDTVGAPKAYPFRGKGVVKNRLITKKSSKHGGASQVWNNRVRKVSTQGTTPAAPVTAGTGWKLINGKRRFVNEQPTTARAELTSREILHPSQTEMRNYNQTWRPKTADEAMLAQRKMESGKGKCGKGKRTKK